MDQVIDRSVDKFTTKSTCTRQQSDLSPSGFTYTLVKGHRWCEEQVNIIRLALGDNIEIAYARMWTFRHDDREMLALLVGAGDNIAYDSTITTNAGRYENELSGNEVYVPDLVEAIHLAGIIFQSLGLPVSIGCLGNETNEEVLQVKLISGQTNGPIRLV